MGDMMTFPASVEEFMEQYKITDIEHVYSNGTEYVPIYRMKHKYTCGAGTPEEAEANCTSFIDGECTASFCEYRREKQTNADRIRAMSDEELAEMLWKTGRNYRAVCADPVVDHNEQYAELVEWLKQPTE